LIMPMRFIILITLIGVGLWSCNQTEHPEMQDLDLIGVKINEYLDLEAEAGFSGVIAVKRPGQDIQYRSYGYSNKERAIFNSEQTVFDIGSLTKQFTAAAILKLEMQGKLSVTDSLFKYFPEIPNDRIGITIHHLLTHTAGLPRSFGSDFERLKKDNLIIRAFQTKLQYEPGTGFKYSHVGYSLLGILIERVSGVSYENYLQENLFKPADMNNTGYILPQWDLSTVANGYSRCRNFGKPMDVPWDAEGPYWNLKANGGLLSTAVDMMAWIHALDNNLVLNEKAKEKYLKKHVSEGKKSVSHYSYGWTILDSRRNTQAFVHEGGNQVFYSRWVNYPQEQVSILLLSNESRLGNSDINFELAATIFYPNHEPVVKGLQAICMDSLPDNRLGEVAGEFIGLMTTQGLEDLEAFIDDYVGVYMSNKYSRKRITDELQSIQNESGPTRIKQLRVIDHRILEIELVRIPDLQDIYIRLQLDPEDNYLLKRFYYKSDDS